MKLSDISRRLRDTRTKQLLEYKRVGERFGMTVAMKARTEISPGKWESSLINLND